MEASFSCTPCSTALSAENRTAQGPHTPAFRQSRGPWLPACACLQHSPAVRQPPARRSGCLRLPLPQAVSCPFLISCKQGARDNSSDLELAVPSVMQRLLETATASGHILAPLIVGKQGKGLTLEVPAPKA
eukprot:1152565-Pelagomonas_calceolata.AAC.10